MHTRFARRLKMIGLGVLVSALPGAALTTGCNIGGCTDPAYEYGGVLALVTLDAAAPTEVPLEISHPSDGGTASTWIDFSLRCQMGEEPAGEYRILRDDGTELARGSMSGWCLPDDSRSGGGWPDPIPTSELDCSDGVRCVGTFRVELTPTSSIGDRELEARLNRGGIGTCGDTSSASRSDARIDAWGE